MGWLFHHSLGDHRTLQRLQTFVVDTDYLMRLRQIVLASISVQEKSPTTRELIFDRFERPDDKWRPWKRQNQFDKKVILQR